MVSSPEIVVNPVALSFSSQLPPLLVVVVAHFNVKSTYAHEDSYSPLVAHLISTVSSPHLYIDRSRGVTARPEVGTGVGSNVGTGVGGGKVGVDEGCSEGARLGTNVGIVDGLRLGSKVGSSVGTSVGLGDGIKVGYDVGLCVNVGNKVGS